MKTKYRKHVSLSEFDRSIGVFTVGVHMIPWHLRWGQALCEGVHVIVLLLQCSELHLLLLLLLLNVGKRGAQALHLRAQTATGGRCGEENTHLKLYALQLNFEALIWPSNLLCLLRAHPTFVGLIRNLQMTYWNLLTWWICCHILKLVSYLCDVTSVRAVPESAAAAAALVAAAVSWPVFSSETYIT